jgi:hypothetical protein
MGISRGDDDSVIGGLESQKSPLTLIRTKDGRLVPRSDPNDRVDNDEVLSRPAEEPALKAALTKDAEDTRDLVKANRQQIEELRQRRSGVSLSDDLNTAWLIAAILLVILALAARAVTRAVPLEAPLLLAASIALVVLITLGLSLKKRLIRRHRERP